MDAQAYVNSFIYLFNKYLLNSYSVPVTILDVGILTSKQKSCPNGGNILKKLER